MSALRLGTRGSALALRQTEAVSIALAADRIDSEPVVIRTAGDRERDASLLQIGGQGVFVRQIEEALSAGEIDVAVHSAKDVPSELLAGTRIAATLPRADVRDALVGGRLAELPARARVGTGSRRRAAQLLAARPDLVPTDIRGNVDTRLRKLAEGEYDALLLAAAGLQRLDRADAASELLSIEVMLPAPGQGVIALQCRDGDEDPSRPRSAVDHAPPSIALRAERALLATLGAGCTLPIGALAHTRVDEVALIARVLDAEGERSINTQESGPIDEPESVGRRAGESLLARGATELLQEPVR